MRIFLSGDVMTGRGIDQIMRHPADPALYESWVRSATGYVDLAERRAGPIPRRVDPSYIWGEALDVLDREGFPTRVVNLETAVTDRGEPWPGKGIHYRMHPRNVETLLAGGIDCCVLSNNHVLDWSYAGLRRTLHSLHDAGVATAGAGEDAEEAFRPAVVDGNSRGRVIVAALGSPSSGIPGAWQAGDGRPGVALATSLSSQQVASTAERITTARAPGDIVIVSIHWGSNWGYDIPPSHMRFARDLIDHADVHVVHGHSSHHPLGIEVHRGRPILYGCGDLINDYEGIGGREEYHPDLGILYLLTMDADAGQLQKLELVPMRMRRFRLEHAPPEEVEWLATTLSREGSSLGTVVEPGGGRLQVRW
ncbi:MAG: CapA family protein [Actinomycetota bacterium]